MNNIKEAKKYVAHYNKRYSNSKILSVNQHYGIVFCSKDKEPFNGYGVYEIVHVGDDKTGKPYAIAEPVCDLSTATGHTKAFVKTMIGFKQNDINSEILKNRFITNGGIDISMNDLTFDDVLDWLKNHTISDLNAAIESSVTYDIPYTLVPERKAFAFPLGVTPRYMLPIKYENGCNEWQPATWVYKNRKLLTDYSIKTIGNKAENVRVVLKPLDNQ